MAYFVLLTALAISAVAAWYSIAGLAAIFSAAVLPIIIMGSVLVIATLFVMINILVDLIYVWLDPKVKLE